MTTDPHAIELIASDGYRLGARAFGPVGSPVVVISAAIGVPARFYGRFAAHVAERGFRALTYDYRGIGDSRSPELDDADISTWAGQDLTAAVEWARSHSGEVHMVGHSLGGQIAGLLENTTSIRSMVTVVGQSGHWRLQGGHQPLLVALHGYVSIPLMVATLGYGPFKRLGLGEDIPGGAARQWAAWIRHRDYLFGDAGLELHRYRSFTAPILAYSVDDDDWGTARAVDDLMLRYPNVERRHLRPADYGMGRIGHMGVFRPDATAIWDEILEWLDRH